jgi:hypothetical protein
MIRYDHLPEETFGRRKVALRAQHEHDDSRSARTATTTICSSAVTVTQMEG